MRESVDNVNLNPQQDPASDEVLELVHAVMHQFRAQLFQAQRLGAHELTHMESKVLRFFARHPGATQSDLVQQSGRDKAQLARLIKNLRDHALLHAEADAQDRRNLRLSVTPAGLEIHEALQLQARQLEAQAVVGLAAADKTRLVELLRQVQRNLSADKS